MMFADAGHGALLLLVALLVRLGPAAPAGRAAPGLAVPRRRRAGEHASSACSTASSSARPVCCPCCWLAPLDAAGAAAAGAAIGLGAVLLAGAYALGTVNRWREGGWRLRAVRPVRARRCRRSSSGSAWSPPAGTCGLGWLAVAGGAVAVARRWCSPSPACSPKPAAAGPAVLQAAIELFDIVVRLGSNLVVLRPARRLRADPRRARRWSSGTATTALWGRGARRRGRARSLVFLVGNALAFALEGLVAGVQALRLEYYELFSRVFAGRGTPVPALARARSREEALTMTWLLAVPALSLAVAAARTGSTRRWGRRALRLVLAVDGVLLVAALRRCWCSAARRPPGRGGRRRRWSPRPRPASADQRQRADRRRDRGRRLLDRRGDRRRLHRLGRAGGDERAARAVRPGHGHRRPGRGHRHLRPDRRDHPDRQGVSVAGDQSGRRDRRRGRGSPGSRSPGRASCPRRPPRGAPRPWAALPADVALVILTPPRPPRRSAAAADRAAAPRSPAVLPP